MKVCVSKEQRISTDPAILLLGLDPKEPKAATPNRYECAHLPSIRTAALFTGSYPRVHGQVNRMGSIHAVEQSPALKREDIRTPAATRMSLEDTVLRETSQTQKDGYCRTH